ncbi:MAG: precorrin-6A reductase [Oscillospiraceae bacterium]|nr:precorrin-6A reductase [Oscillospiraceae bacterium]
MYKICVFAGTTEGRELVEFLASQNISVTACVATEYGQTLLSPADNLTISAKRLTEPEMVDMLLKSCFDVVVDATHPYASMVTENIVAACAETGTEYLRLLRSGAAATEDAVFVSDIAGAVEYLNTADGNILLTTGSKELIKFVSIRDFENRIFARVLPMEESLRLCQEAGVKNAHILAMQGPFSEEMNVAMLKSVDAKYMVTKDSGSKGGFDEKIAAAREAGAKLVVIGRPPQKDGLDYHDTVALLCQRFGFIRKSQVTVVGIGPGSKKAMTDEVRDALSQADCIIGAKRMVEAVAGGHQTVHHAIAPEAIAGFIREHREHSRFVVAMSGDVGFFSGTKKLLPMLENCDVTVLPGLSSLVYLCARLGTSYEDVLPISIHGRDNDIIPDIRRNKRVFALVGGENGMGNLCRELTAAGLGFVKISVGEKLSYPDEQITVGTAEDLQKRVFQSLSVALIENENANPVVTHGLPDDAFDRTETVPMTKSEVRCVCLSKLALTEKAVAWDVGAGTGSVAIEMALQVRKGAVYAIERKDAAVEILQENVRKFRTSNLTVVPGIAPEACATLPAPTHAFIGGSSGNMKEIIGLLLQKNPNVRIVATAIALESVGELTECMKHFRFDYAEVISMTVARNRKAGSYNLMTGQNPIYIFTMQGGKL